MLDDARHEDGALPSHRAGGLYDIYRPKCNALKPAGEYNDVAADRAQRPRRALAQWLSARGVRARFGRLPHARGSQQIPRSSRSSRRCIAAASACRIMATSSASAVSASASCSARYRRMGFIFTPRSASQNRLRRHRRRLRSRRRTDCLHADHGRRAGADARGGRRYSPETETPMFQTPHQAPLRGAGTPTSPSASTMRRSMAAGRLPGEPYVNASEDRAALRVVARAHAGRTHESLGAHLAAQRPLRFQAAHPRRPGLRLADHLRGPRAVLRQGRDADRRLRRERRAREHAGLAARLSAAAAEAAGQRPADRSSAPRRLGIPVVAGHRAVLTQQLDWKRSAGEAASGQSHCAEDPARRTCSSRAACFWATPCGRGCSIRANYQSTTVHLPPALATGKLDIVTDAMVREVTLDKRRLAHAACASSTRPRARTARRRRASWCWRRAPASRCASCSIRSRRSSRTGSPTRAARSASTSWTRSAATSAGRSRSLESLPPHNEDGAERRSHVRAVVALQGAARRQARISRAAITSSSAAAARCRA